MHADGKSTLASVLKWNSGKVNCLSQNLEQTNIYEYNLYIGDVKVSPEGRC